MLTLGRLYNPHKGVSPPTQTDRTWLRIIDPATPDVVTTYYYDALLGWVPDTADIFWGGAVNGIANNPPVSPSYGDRYIVGDTPTGVWVGQAGKKAMWSSTDTYEFIDPVPGERLGHITSTDIFAYIGGFWYTVQPGFGVSDLGHDPTSPDNDTPASITAANVAYDIASTANSQATSNTLNLSILQGELDAGVYNSADTQTVSDTDASVTLAMSQPGVIYNINAPISASLITIDDTGALQGFSVLFAWNGLTPPTFSGVTVSYIEGAEFIAGVDNYAHIIKLGLTQYHINIYRLNP